MTIEIVKQENPMKQMKQTSTFGLITELALIGTVGHVVIVTVIHPLLDLIFG